MPRGSSAGPTTWTILDPRSVLRTSPSDAPPTRSIRLAFEPGRAPYTLLAHSFAFPRDWSARSYLFLKYHGTGSGAVFRLFVDFDRSHARSASYEFADTAPGDHVAAFSTRAVAEAGLPSAWRHVVSVRIVDDSKQAGGALEGTPKDPRFAYIKYDS